MTSDQPDLTGQMPEGQSPSSTEDPVSPTNEGHVTFQMMEISQTWEMVEGTAPAFDDCSIKRGPLVREKAVETPVLERVTTLGQEVGPTFRTPRLDDLKARWEELNKPQPAESYSSLFRKTSVDAVDGGTGDAMGDFAWMGRKFKKRECSAFSPKHQPSTLHGERTTGGSPSLDDSRCNCGRRKEDHSPLALAHPLPPGEPWSPRAHTMSQPTDAYGTIAFRSEAGKKKIAHFVRADAFETKLDNLLELFLVKWGVPLPNIIISITGGALDFNLKPDLNLQFKRGLVKAAANTGAWIITGGTHLGVMSYVGSVIADQPVDVRNSLTLIGFSSWGVVYNNRSLLNGNKSSNQLHRSGSTDEYSENVNRLFFQRHEELQYHTIYRLPQSSSEKRPGLDPNHTHFVLADNGTEDRFGVEIDLRAEFEDYVARQVAAREGGSKCIVVLLVEGGANSVKTVAASLSRQVPVVIVEDSGRAADILAFALRNCSFESDKTAAKFSAEAEAKIRAEMKRNFNQWGAPIERLKRDQPRNWESRIEDIEKVVDLHFGLIKNICNRSNRKYVTVFSVGENDLDKAILTSLLTCMKSRGKSSEDEASVRDIQRQLRFAVKWNRADTAKMHLFNQKRDWGEGFLQQIFLECLFSNQPDFIKLLLLNGVSVEDLASVHVLEQLFTPENSRSEMMYRFLLSIKTKYKFLPNYLYSVLRGVKSIVGGGVGLSFVYDKAFNDSYTAFTIRRTAKEQELRDQSEEEGLSQREIDELVPPLVDDPEIIFLIWAIIMGYQDLAMIFCLHGEEVIAKALLAMRFYQALVQQSIVSADQAEDYIAYSREFGDLGLELMDRCYKSEQSMTMLVCNLRICNTHSMFGLAKLAGHQHFIAHAMPQAILNEMWSGGIKQCDNMELKVMCSILFPPLIPMMFDYDLSGNVFDYKASQKRIKRIERNRQGSSLPRTRAFVRKLRHRERSLSGGVANLQGDVLQKATREYVMTEEERREQHEMGVLRKFYYFYTSPVATFFLNMLMFILFLLLFTYFVLGELPERRLDWIEISLASFVLSVTTEELRQIVIERGQPKKKITEYFSNGWNRLDDAGIFLFWLAFGLAFIDNSQVRGIARLVYIFDLFLWYMRLLNIFMISRYLGTFVTVILRMIPIVIRFFVIWLLFMLTFGIVITAILEPRWPRDIRPFVFLHFLTRTYWETYGELFLDDYYSESALVNGINCSWPLRSATNPDLPPCPFFPYIGLVFLGIYMIFGNILLLNLLIAIFTSVYDETMSASLTGWKNKRMQLIIEYHTRPALPPPFTVLYHIYVLLAFPSHVQWAMISTGLTIPVLPELRARLGAIEDASKEEYLMEKSTEQANNVSNQIREMSERVGEIGERTSEMIRSVEQRLQEISSRDRMTHSRPVNLSNDHTPRDQQISSQAAFSDSYASLQQRVTELETKLEAKLDMIPNQLPSRSSDG